MDTIKLPRYLVEDALSNASVLDFGIRENYSGRFMYGETCLGVVLDRDAKPRFLNRLREVIIGGEYTDDELDDLDDDEVAEYDEACTLANRVINRALTDNMGLSMIVYFPGVELES
jgi:hypothetical protein